MLRAIRLLSNLLWTTPLAAVAAFFVWGTRESLADPGDSRLAVGVTAAIAAVLVATFLYAVRLAVKEARELDSSRPSARNETTVNLFLQLVFLAMGATVWPAFSSLIVVSSEGARKANLFALREAFDRYAAKKGRPPRLEALVEEGVLPRLPRMSFPRLPHRATFESVNLEPGVYTDSGRWGYTVEGSTPVFIDCTHTDHRRGVQWNHY